MMLKLMISFLDNDRNITFIIINNTHTQVSLFTQFILKTHVDAMVSNVCQWSSSHYFVHGVVKQEADGVEPTSDVFGFSLVIESLKGFQQFLICFASVYPHFVHCLHSAEVHFSLGATIFWERTDVHPQAFSSKGQKEHSQNVNR